MGDSMVTGRMSASKKHDGARILHQEGLTASQAINLMYDRMVKDGSAGFLQQHDSSGGMDDWAFAAHFVDELSSRRPTRFDSMSPADIRRDRLKARGLM